MKMNDPKQITQAIGSNWVTKDKVKSLVQQMQNAMKQPEKLKHTFWVRHIWD